MFDENCGTLRDIVEDALKRDLAQHPAHSKLIVEANATPENTSITFTDVGLAVEINSDLYGIIIDKV